MMEFGIDHKFWWKKQSQILRYVKRLLKKRMTTTDATPNEATSNEATSNEATSNEATSNEATTNEATSNKATSNKLTSNKATIKATSSKATSNVATLKTDESFTFDKPILLTIVNVDKPTYADGKTSMKARFGMFLCTRKESNDTGGCASDDYRIALLWRTQTTTCEDASTEFGKVLYAAQMCAYLRKQEFVYEYLGPNCCRFKDFVSTLRFDMCVNVSKNFI